MGEPRRSFTDNGEPFSLLGALSEHNVGNGNLTEIQASLYVPHRDARKQYVHGRSVSGH
jgi:hypothetical protein